MRQWLCPLALGLLLMGNLPAEEQTIKDPNTPHWVREYLKDPLTDWNHWQNSLSPKGEAKIIPLSQGGSTKYRIVIPTNPSKEENKSAKELAHWLNKMTGADFPIVKDSEEPADYELSVGRTNRLAASGVADESDTLGEGYRISVVGNRVFLQGGVRPGPFYAVMALLEEDLGIRWYAPDADRVPSAPTLQARIVPRTDTPAFMVRDIRQLAGTTWYARNRLNFGKSIPGEEGVGYPENFSYRWVGGVHTVHLLVPPKRYFQSNPEFFSLIDGKRKWEKAQINLTSDGAVDAAVDTLLRAFAKDEREAASSGNKFRWKTLPVMVGPMDWTGECESEESMVAERRLGSRGALYLDFTKKVAAKVRKKYPDATFQVVAYRQTKEPPDKEAIKAGPGVGVRFCTDFGADFDWPYHSFYDEKFSDQKEMLLGWKAVSSEPLHIYSYPHNYRNVMVPEPNTHAVAERLRFFAEQGVEKVLILQHRRELFQWDGGHMRNWIWAKLLWNPFVSVNDLMRDFIFGYYGSAAPEVLRYHDFLIRNLAENHDFGKKLNWFYPIQDLAMFDGDFVTRGREILSAAMAAADSETTRQRLQPLLLGVVYVEAVLLYEQMRKGDTVPDPERYDRVVAEFLELAKAMGNRRIRYYDGATLIDPPEEFAAAMEREKRIRLHSLALRGAAWGEWTFLADPDDVGQREQWFTPGKAPHGSWKEVKVPAMLAESGFEDFTGFGWYRNTFDLKPEQLGGPMELRFEGVDEQAWIYVNGQLVGEHTLESEFLVGQEITVQDLWNKPFSVNVPQEVLKEGQNSILVRIHNSGKGAGIHRPVTAFPTKNDVP